MFTSRSRLVCLAFCLAIANHAAASCEPIEGIQALLKPGRVLLLGELHGTVESPEFTREVACHAAGVERIRWHDLRHYYASQLLDKFGDNLHAVASIMGHEDIATTRKIYGHWLADDARDQIIGDDLARAIFD